MAVHKIKKGLNLPVQGEPEQAIDTGRQPARVALVAADYVGLKPTMHVQEGDSVRRGQLLLEDKKTPGVRYTAIAGGKVVGIHRGARRALQSVVIELSKEEMAGSADGVRFAADTNKHPSELTGEQVRELLLESGLWTALRARPFGKVADPATTPKSVFVRAMDTHPLAPEAQVVVAGREDLFERGLAAIAKLPEEKVYVCTAPGSGLTVPALEKVSEEQFSGPHPAGTAGVHIHTLDPVDRKKVVWYLDYQDVIAIGKLFSNGELDVSRVISLGGAPVARPRLLRTRLGAALGDLVRGELDEGELRVISGSVLAGRKADLDAPDAYLGRYDHQISVLPEGREREFLGWLAPGAKKFSTSNVFLSRLLPGRKLPFTTTTHGSDRAIVPLGIYERVFPIDIPPSFLLRSLVMGDVERAQELGCLELAEEDVALCSFVCPGKHEYGPHLRDILNTIEKDG